MMKLSITLIVILLMLAAFLMYDYYQYDDSVIIPVEEVHYRPCADDACEVKGE